MHVSDAVRAIEAAARVGDYAKINIGHLEVVPMARLEMIRAELNAPPVARDHDRASSADDAHQASGAGAAAPPA